ncbi:hypothetical protein FOCC_FOCC011262 [Frankliniella occidentalis]|nr:hypothetical protein FOCC_FOCC011262 [Frankliniella occidentalis]
MLCYPGWARIVRTGGQSLVDGLGTAQVGGLTYVKLRSSMIRARRENLPPVPHSLLELATILEDPNYSFLNKTLDGQDRVYIGKFGQTAQGTRCLMFSSERALEYMSSQHSPVLDVLSDATFCIPTVLNGRQIWSIVTIRRNHVIVLVRFVMQTKSEACYKVCLEALKALVPDFRPRTVMCDFEPAQCNAWEAVYPLATLSGCLFHSSKVLHFDFNHCFSEVQKNWH